MMIIEEELKQEWCGGSRASFFYPPTALLSSPQKHEGSSGGGGGNTHHQQLLLPPHHSHMASSHHLEEALLLCEGGEGYEGVVEGEWPEVKELFCGTATDGGSDIGGGSSSSSHHTLVMPEMEPSDGNDTIRFPFEDDNSYWLTDPLGINTTNATTTNGRTLTPMLRGVVGAIPSHTTTCTITPPAIDDSS